MACRVNCVLSWIQDQDKFFIFVKKNTLKKAILCGWWFGVEVTKSSESKVALPRVHLLRSVVKLLQRLYNLPRLGKLHTSCTHDIDFKLWCTLTAVFEDDTKRRAFIQATVPVFVHKRANLSNSFRRHFIAFKLPWGKFGSLWCFHFRSIPLDGARSNFFFFKHRCLKIYVLISRLGRPICW